MNKYDIQIVTMKWFLNLDGGDKLIVPKSTSLRLDRLKTTERWRYRWRSI